MQITITLAEEYVPWRCAQRDARAKKSKGKFIAPTTAKRELVTLSAAINFCHKDKKVTGESTFVKIPGDYVRRDRYLTRGEVARLLLGALGWDLRTGKRNRYRINRHAARALLIGFYTGTRIGVIRKLGWMPSTVNGWFDLDKGHLYRSPQDAVETNKKRPTCEIPAKLLRKHLRRWRRLSARYVIEHEGQQVGSLKRSLKGAQELSGLGVEVTSHVLRHTCITLKLHAGVAIDDVADFVGVSALIIRKHYKHHAVAQSRAAANAGF
jgi:integrase